MKLIKKQKEIKNWLKQTGMIGNASDYEMIAASDTHYVAYKKDGFKIPNVEKVLVKMVSSGKFNLIEYLEKNNINPRLAYLFGYPKI